MNTDQYRALIDSVLIDIRPYLKSEGEMMLGSLLAQVMVKSNLVAQEHIELGNRYKELTQAYDEMKNLVFELSKKIEGFKRILLKKI